MRLTIPKLTDLPKKSLQPGVKNVLNKPSANSNNGLLPPLHIKLGHIKSSVSRMNQEGKVLKYLREIFPRLSDARVKDGIFIGLEIWEHLRNPAW